MKLKDRQKYKRDRIRNLYVYQHKSLRDIADFLNNDPEFKRICGTIAVPTVQYWVSKIKKELDNAISIDGLERFTAEFVRASEFMDGTISDISKMLENPNLKQGEKITLINLRHRILIDKMTLLADRELPLTVKKYKKDREKFMKVLPMEPEDTPELDVKWPEDSQA